MSQVYSNPKRESDPYALPDVEVFYMDEIDCKRRQEEYEMGLSLNTPEVFEFTPGWYWWACLPGCLPDSDPIGPFDTEQDAIDDAQSDAWQDDNDSDE